MAQLPRGNQDGMVAMKAKEIIDEHMQNGYFRYEVLRRFNVHQFSVVFERNILMGVRFDYMIDQLRGLPPEECADQFSAWERENHLRKCMAGSNTLNAAIKKSGTITNDSGENE